MIVPRGPTIIEAGDEILAVTDAAASDQLAKLFAARNH
jgi:Trk K+ transport system NAD-binding subunit